MHPSAIRWHQGFYGPRTTEAVAKDSKAIGCNGGGVFTDRVRAHLLKELASPRPSEELLLPKNTPFGPGSFGPSVVKLQKVLIKLGHMHPSAIRWHQGFYGPLTTEAVAKVSKKNGCDSGGVFTDRVRAHLLKELASPRPAAVATAGVSET